MPDPYQHHQNAESFAGKTRLESVTLRCGREEMRRIKGAYFHECGLRPKLSLGRFLAECVTNGLPGNLPPSSAADLDNLALLVAEQLDQRLASIEAAIPVIADVLQEMTLRIAGIDSAANQIREDAATVREIIVGVAARESDGTGDTSDSMDGR